MIFMKIKCSTIEENIKGYRKLLPVNSTYSENIIILYYVCIHLYEWLTGYCRGIRPNLDFNI